jgi:biofilm protein TabA
MIVTDLGHIDRQIPMTLDMRNALTFLRQPGIHNLEEGKIEIDGNKVFAIVQRYETMKMGTPKFECHRKYLDVQFIVSGEEVIGWAPAEKMAITEPYDADKDVCFGRVAEGKWTPLRLHAGEVTVFWPEDSHMPKVAAGTPAMVMKIVVKVAV